MAVSGELVQMGLAEFWLLTRVCLAVHEDNQIISAAMITIAL